MWFKKLLSRFFYTAYCTSSKSFLDKLYCIKRKLIMQPYTFGYQLLEITTLEVNITRYIKRLEYIMSSDRTKKLRNIPMITIDSYSNINFTYWFTNDSNQFIDKPDEVWLKFITLIIDMQLYYLNIYKDYDSIHNTINSKLIKPYIINLEQIIDAVIINQKEL